MDIADHVAAFNAAVRDGDWAAFADRFAADAELAFVGVPAGPFVGRRAIAQAYAESPPDDTLSTIGEPSVDGRELVVRYAWTTTGETGTMRLTAAADGLVERLVVTFD